MKIMTILLIFILIIFTVMAGTTEKAETKECTKKTVKPETKKRQTEQIPKRVEKFYVDAPGSDFKSFMDGRFITDETSAAYKQFVKLSADENGIYSDGKFKGIAMDSYYGEIGDKFLISLSSGEKFFGVMTDTKQKAHVNHLHADKMNGSIIEFVVNYDYLPKQVKIEGSLNCIYPGRIEMIEKL